MSRTRLLTLIPARPVRGVWMILASALPILFFGSQQVPCFSIDEVEPRAGPAFDDLVFIFRHVLAVVQPVLDVQLCYWALENERRHPLSLQSGDAGRVT